MTKYFRILSAFLLILSGANSYANTTLRFIGDVNLRTGEKFQNTEIGGLSGMVYDSKQNKILAVSDDRSFVNEARFYEFDLILTSKVFSVKPSAVVKLKNQDGAFFQKGYVDFEGISMKDGDVLISSEGGMDLIKKVPHELYRFSRTGEFKERLTVPSQFLPPQKEEASKPFGSRDNKSIEALSTTLDGKTTFMGSEEALLQDGPVSTNLEGSTVRIIRYKDLKPESVVAYKMDAIKTVPGIPDPAADSGLVDIAAIDENNFYSMERSYLPEASKNVIRIFLCKITNKTTDISKYGSLNGMSSVSVEKTLVADLEDFLPLMKPSKLDNIEGIVLGPKLPDGHSTLIVVSDNNFADNQRTLFMAFEVLGDSKTKVKTKK